MTFNVDMSVQESLGNFNSTNGSVVVIGSFNDWSTENGTIALADIGNGVYSGNGSIFGSEGTPITYKFFNTTPGTGFEQGADRSLTLGPIDVDQAIPVVYFSNQLPTRDVTFSVDMSEQITLENFNASTGTVSVVGAFNNWNPESGAILLASSENGVYSGNGSISGLANATVEYKFFNSTPDAPNNGFEAGDNRSLVLGDPGTPQTEPLATYQMPARPTITSASSRNGTVGTSLAYQISTTPAIDEWLTSFALTGNTTLPAGLELNTSTGLISGTPSEAGNTTVELTATNVGGTGAPFTLDFSITQEGTAYDTWATGYELTGEAALPEADPDGDGFTNQQEYAFGTNPTQATAGLLTTSNGIDGLTVVFLTREDLDYNVQTTDNLSTTAFSNNDTVTESVSVSGDQNGVPSGYIRKQFTIEPGPGKNFYRVVASEQLFG